MCLCVLWISFTPFRLTSFRKLRKREALGGTLLRVLQVAPDRDKKGAYVFCCKDYAFSSNGGNSEKHENEYRNKVRKHSKGDMCQANF